MLLMKVTGAASAGLPCLLEKNTLLPDFDLSSCNKSSLKPWRTWVWKLIEGIRDIWTNLDIQTFGPSIDAARKGLIVCGQAIGWNVGVIVKSLLIAIVDWAIYHLGKAILPGDPYLYETVAWCRKSWKWSRGGSQRLCMRAWVMDLSEP